MGGCLTGQAKITKGYKLLAKYVIHTVGPVWCGGNNDEDNKLSNCYRNSLVLASVHNLKSIAFPSISTGAYRFPLERAARIAIGAVKEFLEINDSIEKIIFVCFDRDTFNVYQKISNEK